MKSIDLLQRRLDEYDCDGAEEELNAIREILQEMILAGLARTDFFTKAAFHGGTQLRIFEGIRRYSEDLDFALLSPDGDFELRTYLEKVALELEAVGVTLEVKDKSTADNTIKKGFLKTDSLVRILELRYVGGRGTLGTPGKTLIKLEVDSNPPSGARYRSNALLFPYPASVRCFNRESAFSGKLHALLCRTYIKGRDWFDLVWYAASRRGSTTSSSRRRSTSRGNGPEDTFGRMTTGCENGSRKSSAGWIGMRPERMCGGSSMHPIDRLWIFGPASSSHPWSIGSGNEEPVVPETHQRQVPTPLKKKGSASRRQYW